MSTRSSSRRELTRFNTAQSLKSLKARDRGSAFCFDREVPALALRITAANVRTWTLFYRIERRQRCFKIGRVPHLSLADARESARDARTLVAKRRDPAGERQANRQAPTFRELAERYLKLHAKPHKKTSSVREDRRMIETDLRSWDHRAAREIARLDVQNVLEAIVARGAVVHANRVRALISKIFNFRIERELVELNPVSTGRGVKRPTKERPRERVLTENETRAIWDACDTQPPRIAA